MARILVNCLTCVMTYALHTPSTCALSYQGLPGKAGGPSGVARGTVRVIGSGKMLLMCHSELVDTHAFETSSHWLGHQCITAAHGSCCTQIASLPKGSSSHAYAT